MLKILSLFSGIGAFEKALDNLGVEYELAAFCEFDKHAVKSYCAIHGVDESMNLGDVTKVDETTLPKDLDILTYGFPCQDISLAGKQKGLFNDDGSQTRSGLFFEAMRIIEATQPKIAIAENVKNLVSKKFNAQFQIVLASLESAGYNNYWAVLNAKNFGIPQNRERVFIVSIRKDIDHGIFEFPKPFPLEKRLKDLLEEVVDEKYYLTTKQMEYAIDLKDVQRGTKWEGRCDKGKLNETVARTLGVRSAGGDQRVGVSNFVVDGIDEEIRVEDYKALIKQFGIDKSKNDPRVIDIANCITAREDRGVSHRKAEGTAVCEIKQVGQMYPGGGNPQSGRIYDAEGIAPNMDTCSGGNRMPKVIVPEATKQGYAEAYEGDSINLEQLGSNTRRGRVGHGVAQTLTTTPQQATVVNEPVAVWDGFNQRVRADSTVVGTLTQNCGADLKRNGQGIIEKYYVSEKGVKFIVSPKRGMCTDVNADIIQPLTAKGQANWTGSFVSPDIDHLEKSTTIGSTEPTKIHLKNGDIITSNDDTSHLRIRKLTPKECFRLMGFDDEDFAKAESVNTNTQLYKQAGNSIVVDVLEELFCMMLDEDGNLYV